MNIFEHMRKNNSRELLFFEEQDLKLKAIIAIDSIVLGPANASAKLHPFVNEEEAVSEALDIAYFNSLRASLLKRSLGGGSIIMCGDPKVVKSEMYFRALGVFLNRWNGKLFMTKSKGVSYKDLYHVQKESKFILGLEETHNGLGKIYESRAKGMIWGLKAAAKQKLNTTSLEGLKVIVQGVGDLGSELVKELIKEKTEIIITDKIYDRIKIIQDEVNDIKIVRPDNIYKEKCDIFCSCAIDRIVDEKTVEQLNCKILTGSTNQILKEDNLVKVLEKKGITYIPGYIINGGDIIQLANEIEGFGKDKLEKELVDIYYNTLDLITKSAKNGKFLCKLATEKAEEYVKNVASIKLLK